MVSNSASTNLIIGAAAFGLALVVAGVRFYRRKQAGAGDQMQVSENQGDAIDQGYAQDEGISRDGGDSSGEGDANRSPDNIPLDYFLLVFALSIPFLLLGGDKLPIPIDLPASALQFFNPFIAAAILSCRRSGFPGVRRLVQKAFDAKKIKNKAWYLPILLFNPAIMVLSYAAMRWAGAPLPDPEIPWLVAPVLFLVFLITATGEELGWMGYAFDPMQNRWGALKASIVLGFVWALIHIIPDIQNGHTADWILWQRLSTVATRLLIVWIYNNTEKSVFAAILFHAMNNVSWALFPNYGSHYDPFYTALFTLLAAGIVAIGWESRTFARPRWAGTGGSAG